jgi:hypothetical protein
MLTTSADALKTGELADERAHERFPQPTGRSPRDRLGDRVIGRIVDVGRLLPSKSDRALDADDARVGCDLVSACRLSAGPSWRRNEDPPPHGFASPRLGVGDS